MNDSTTTIREAREGDLEAVLTLYDQNRQSAPHFSGEVNAVHR
jgi:hypothetical protein